MSSSSKIDDMFESLPLSAKAMMCLWTYLVAGGWFSTYMLINMLGETWRENMFEIIGNTFAWIVVVMFVTSLSVIGMLFYGRFKKKQKDVTRASLEEYKETGVYKDPKLKFDYAIIPFWIGGSILNVLASLCILVGYSSMNDVNFEQDIIYIMIGFAIAFFLAVISYMVSELFANGVLDGKWLKKAIASIVGSDEIKAVIKTFAEKSGVPESCVDKIYDKVNTAITAKNYSELTPDEVIALNKAVEQVKAEMGRGYADPNNSVV